ncbi:MAG: tRNA (N6-threonylcarbamoyladenosine(37)-N6)-methyltransferase TrmO [Desulfobulbaceae bacterium]|nr:tRNA (N6-threonylcarbamoyladenosine(37)-N6)-methyltransferase TrmO [Desulfobulbaceae bacterium]
METKLHIIGRIHTPYKKLADCPRNFSDQGPQCTILVDEKYADGLLGLQAGRTILVLYWFENVEREKLQGRSRKSGKFSGVFALRSPARPNPIAVSAVTIERIEGNTIYTRGLDCLDDTPLLDIKPLKSGEDQVAKPCPTAIRSSTTTSTTP